MNIKRYPTPEEWNKKYAKHRPPVQWAPVRCAKCNKQMFYPFELDIFAAEHIVRCMHCGDQTTINNHFEIIGKE